MLVAVVAIAAVAVVAVVVAAQLLYSLVVEAEVGDVGLVVIRLQRRHSRRQSPSLKSARNPNPNSAHHLMRSPYQCRHRDQCHMNQDHHMCLYHRKHCRIAF